MKAEIDENGVLNITSETPLESYALGKWAEDNISNEDRAVATVKMHAFIVKREKGPVPNA